METEFSAMVEILATEIIMGTYIVHTTQSHSSPREKMQSINSLLPPSS